MSSNVTEINQETTYLNFMNNPVPDFNVLDISTNFWLYFFLTLYSIKSLIVFVGYIQQYMLLDDRQKCRKIYNTLDKDHKKQVDWPKADKARIYQKTLYKHRILKLMFSFTKDCIYYYYLCPAWIWSAIQQLFTMFGFCEEKKCGANMELLIGFVYCILDKFLDLNVHSPLHFYNVFFIEKSFGLSEATLWQFFS